MEGVLAVGHDDAVDQDACLMGSGRHVSAKDPTSPCPGFPWSKALKDPTHPDHKTWLAAHKEEHDSIVGMNTYTPVTEAELRRLKVKPIPTMNTLTVKADENGKPVRAKSRTVALGNEEETYWEKNDLFAPVTSKSSARCSVAHGVSIGRITKQCDAKNAFCNANLPDDEACVITPPKGCPFSKPGEHWRLIKTLCGLRRSPRHWHLLFSKALKEMGLTPCPHDPCVFTGASPNGGTICFGCCVDDCLCFGTDDEAEQWFEKELGKKLTIDFMGPVTWHLGVHCEWSRTKDGRLTVHMSQEGHINKMLDQESMEECTATETPCRSGLPIDRVPHDGIEPSHKKPLLKRHASLVGGLNWLSTSTRPDITTATSLLASHLKNPSEGHAEAARHVLKHPRGSTEWGIRCTQPLDSEPDATARQVRGEVSWPVDGGPSSGVESMNRLVVETDANWGPQDASKPKPGEMRKEEECRSMLGAVVICLGGPLDWSAVRERKTSRSTCDAEIKGMDEGCKMAEGIRHLQDDLMSSSTEKPTPLLLSDNQGAMCWAKTDAITKKLRHLNLREVAVRDAVREGAIEIGHIPGPLNLSDMFTKEMRDKVHFIDLRGGLMSPRQLLETDQMGQWGVLVLSTVTLHGRLTCSLPALIGSNCQWGTNAARLASQLQWQQLLLPLPQSKDTINHIMSHALASKATQCKTRRSQRG